MKIFYDKKNYNWNIDCMIIIKIDYEVYVYK